MKTSAKQIAQRYVRALFDVAGNARTRELIEKDFASLKEALESSGDFRQLLTNPLLSREQREAAIGAILDKMRVCEVTQQFLRLLVAQKRLPLLPEIIDMFSDWALRARGEMKVEVVSAAPLSSKDTDAIEKSLKKAYGKDIAMETREDPALLGGVVINVGSVQLDGSLAGKLRRLSLKLKAA